MECQHEDVKKVRFVRDAATPGVHLSEMVEIWEVKCQDCGKKFEEVYSNR